MSLVLHYHPLSSYCQKVLIALDELGIEADLQLLNLGDPAQRAAYLAQWPIGKMPLLVDAGRPIPETSIIIEHLQRYHAAAGRSLLPADADAALEVRLWDRICDQHVMTPMQACTADLLRPPEQRDARAVGQAHEALRTAYGVLESRLASREWLGDRSFSLADCAAAPALFYALTYMPFGDGHGALSEYFERLVARPSVARVIDQARPWFQYYPGKAGLQKRFAP